MVQCPEETHHPVEDADTKPCKVIDNSMAPASTPQQDGGSSWMGGSSYDFVDYDDYDGYFSDDDYMVVVGGDDDGTRGSLYEHGSYSYSYSYGYDGEDEDEEERGSDMSSASSWTEAEEEYCDYSTCCEEKECERGRRSRM